MSLSALREMDKMARRTRKVQRQFDHHEIDPETRACRNCRQSEWQIQMVAGVTGGKLDCFIEVDEPVVDPTGNRIPDMFAWMDDDRIQATLRDLEERISRSVVTRGPALTPEQNFVLNNTPAGAAVSATGLQFSQAQHEFLPGQGQCRRCGIEQSTLDYWTQHKTRIECRPVTYIPSQPQTGHLSVGFARNSQEQHDIDPLTRQCLKCGWSQVQCHNSARCYPQPFLARPKQQPQPKKPEPAVRRKVIRNGAKDT